MSVLFLKEDDISDLVSVQETIGVLEAAFGQQTTG